MKLCVLITFKTHAVRCTGSTRQKRCRRSAVKVIDYVVTRGSQCTCRACSCPQTASLKHHNSIYMGMMVQHGRNPVFNENVDLGVWQKAFQRKNGRCGENGVADRSQSDQQDSSHVAPVPAWRRQGLRRVLTLPSVHFLCVDDAQMWRQLYDVAQAVHRIILRW